MLRYVCVCAFILAGVSPAFAQTSVQSGPWSAASTWGGAVPAAGSSPTIASGHTVTLDTTASVATVTIHGTLKASRSVSSQVVYTGQVIVEPTGVLDQGTQADPINLPVVHRLTSSLQQGQPFVGGANYSADPGVWVRGVWSAYGQKTTRRWGKLNGNAALGAMSVTVDGDVSDWPVGAQIVITQTGDGFTTETELRTIQSVSGSTLGLDAPLTYAHLGTGQERGEVGLLSSNVILETNIAGISATQIRTTQNVRKFACARIWSGGKAYLSYALFDRMGSYGINGCFALHWHRLGDVGRGQYGIGLSFLDTGFRSTNVHESNGVRVEDTVSAFSGNGIVHWVQTDTPSLQVDHEQVHNLVAGHEATDGSVAFGEAWDEAAAFWPGFSDHEFFAGNVSAGRGYSAAGTSGFAFFAGVRGTPSSGVGQVPRVFINNEAHGLLGVGILSGAQRDIPFTDTVGAHAWRNVYGGIRAGSYNYRLMYHRARLVENPIGFFAFASSMLLQDATIIGRGPNAPRLGPNYQNGPDGQDVGIRQSNNSQYPFEPKRFHRVSIADLTPGQTDQLGIGLIWPGSSVRADGLCDPYLSLTFPGGECASGWVRAAGVTFGPGLRPFKYTATLNANDALFDFTQGAVLFRPDQNPPTGAASQRFFVSGVTTYDAGADALKTPFSALPPTLEFLDATGFPPATLDFTSLLTHNEPPQVEIGYTLANGMLTITATPSSDTTKVEYFVDYTKVGETTGGPHQITVSVANHPRRYAYVYARAFDGETVDTGCADFGYATDCKTGYQQRGYSSVLELGPELLFASTPPPPPPPTYEELVELVNQLQQQVATLNTTITSLQNQVQGQQVQIANQAAQIAALQAKITQAIAVLQGP